MYSSSVSLSSETELWVHSKIIYHAVIKLRLIAHENLVLYSSTDLQVVVALYHTLLVLPFSLQT